MKKRNLVGSLMVAFSLIVSLTACSTNGSGSEGGTQTTASSESSKNESQEAQKWPTGDVTLVVPAAAGGGTDIFARIVANYMQSKTGYNFTVLNQDSGGGMVAYENVRNSKPDGNTLLFWHTGFYVNNYSGTYQYNPNTDFTPISMLSSKNSTQVFVVSAKSEWNNIEDLANAAKAAPNTITYGCQKGGSAQLVAEILMQETESELRLVDAASQTDKITGVVGGNIDVAAISTGAAAQYVDSGDLKVIGIVDKASDPMYPDFTSAVDQGYENLFWTQNLCIFGPAGIEQSLTESIAAAFDGFSEDETAAKQMEDAKMVMYFLPYEESKAAFVEYDELVKNVYANMK